MILDETRAGPIGANLSNHLPLPCWPPDLSAACQYRDETSFPAVYPRTYCHGSSDSLRSLQSLPITRQSSA